MVIDSVRTRVKEWLPNRVTRRIIHWMNILSTEFHYRFRQAETQNILKDFRQIPRGFHIEVINICNARCVFCAYPQMQRRKQAMSMEDFRMAVEQYIEMGGHYVSLSPLVGDPFVDPHIYDRLEYLYGREPIKGFYFFTNAILMKPEQSERLLAYAEKLVINVSWGGFDRETYKIMMGVDKFDAALENVEALIEKKRNTQSELYIAIHLRCPPSSCQGEIWEKFQGYLAKGLINEISDLKGFDTWAGKISPDKLREVGLEPYEVPYKRGACELLYMKPIVLSDGRVNACGCRDVEAELIVGDIHKNKLSEIWGGKEIDKIIERHENNDFPDVCKRCTYYVSVHNRRWTSILWPSLNWYQD